MAKNILRVLCIITVLISTACGNFSKSNNNNVNSSGAFVSRHSSCANPKDMMTSLYKNPLMRYAAGVQSENDWTEFVAEALGDPTFLNVIVRTCDAAAGDAIANMRATAIAVALLSGSGAFTQSQKQKEIIKKQSNNDHSLSLNYAVLLNELQAANLNASKYYFDNISNINEKYKIHRNSVNKSERKILDMLRDSEKTRLELSFSIGEFVRTRTEKYKIINTSDDNNKIVISYLQLLCQAERLRPSADKTHLEKCRALSRNLVPLPKHSQTE